MGILGKYFMQGSFKKFYYHTTCDLSGASVMVHLRNSQGQTTAAERSKHSYFQQETNANLIFGVQT